MSRRAEPDWVEMRSRGDVLLRKWGQGMRHRVLRQARELTPTLNCGLNYEDRKEGGSNAVNEWKWNWPKKMKVTTESPWASERPTASCGAVVGGTEERRAERSQPRSEGERGVCPSEDWRWDLFKQCFWNSRRNCLSLLPPRKFSLTEDEAAAFCRKYLSGDKASSLSPIAVLGFFLHWLHQNH